MNDVNIINSTDMKILRHNNPQLHLFLKNCVKHLMDSALWPLKNTVIIHMVFVGNLNVSTLQNRSTYLLADDTVCASALIPIDPHWHPLITRVSLHFWWGIRRTSEGLFVFFSLQVSAQKNINESITSFSLTPVCFLIIKLHMIWMHLCGYKRILGAVHPDNRHSVFTSHVT